MAAWDERWTRRQEIEAKRKKNLSRSTAWERQIDFDRSARAVALERTKEAEKSIEVLNTLLQAALVKPAGFDWNRLCDLAAFSKPVPALPQLKTWPQEPQRTDPTFLYSPARLNLSIIDWLIPPLKHAKQAKAQAAENLRRDEANNQYKQAHDAWQFVRDQAEKYNTSAKLTYGVAQASWLKEKKSYEEGQLTYNAGLAELRKKYLAKD